MRLKLYRFNDNGVKTLGVLSIDNVAHSFVVEDTFRDVKVYGETRIPKGIYKIEWHTAETQKTLDYRKRFPDFFRYHFILRDVKNYEGVLIHLGNTEKDSEGCLLLNGTVDLIAGNASDSTRAYKLFYTKVGSALNAKEDVTIEIIDGDRNGL